MSKKSERPILLYDALMETINDIFIRLLGEYTPLIPETPEHMETARECFFMLCQIDNKNPTAVYNRIMQSTGGNVCLITALQTDLLHAIIRRGQTPPKSTITEQQALIITKRYQRPDKDTTTHTDPKKPNAGG